MAHEKNEENSLIDVSDGGDSSAESVTTDEESEGDLKEEGIILLDEKSVEKKQTDNEEDVSVDEGVSDGEDASGDEDADLTKFSMPTLRKMAEERNLEKYKSLRKNDLIELIKSSE